MAPLFLLLAISLVSEVNSASFTFEFKETIGVVQACKESENSLTWFECTEHNEQFEYRYESGAKQKLIICIQLKNVLISGEACVKEGIVIRKDGKAPTHAGTGNEGGLSLDERDESVRLPDTDTSDDEGHKSLLILDDTASPDESLSPGKEDETTKDVPKHAKLSKGDWEVLYELICDTTEIKKSTWKLCYLLYGSYIKYFQFRSKPDNLCIELRDRSLKNEIPASFDEIHGKGTNVCPKNIKDKVLKAAKQAPKQTEACSSHEACKKKFTPLHVCLVKDERSPSGICYELRNGQCLDLSHCLDTWKVAESRNLQCYFDPPLNNVEKQVIRQKTSVAPRIGTCGDRQGCSQHQNCDQQQFFRCFADPEGQPGICRKLDLSGKGECLDDNDCKLINKVKCDFSGILSDKAVSDQVRNKIATKVGRCRGCASHDECIRIGKKSRSPKQLKCLIRENKFPTKIDGKCFNMKKSECVVSADCSGSADSYTCDFSHLSATDQKEQLEKIATVAALGKFGTCLDSRALGDVSSLPRGAVDVELRYPRASVEQALEEQRRLREQCREAFAAALEMRQEFLRFNQFFLRKGSVIMNFTAEFPKLQEDADYEKIALDGIKSNPELFSFGEDYTLDVDSVSVQRTSVTGDGEGASGILSPAAVGVVGGVVLVCIIVIAAITLKKRGQQRHSRYRTEDEAGHHQHRHKADTAKKNVNKEKHGMRGAVTEEKNGKNQEQRHHSKTNDQRPAKVVLSGSVPSGKNESNA